ncbi:hypothetical protein HAX54_018556 [Datura stramonium]|uniref:Isopenicillin N synthase-like Fe(2+) 2OG dioxygenase domain-containing protein n=1 Tax=Datura stramonium TaxID=4076 RepID=A0ABS8UMP5_DATST|nr:hypothetical protein [Datura stramonium]
MEEQVVELYELHYADLIQLSSEKALSEESIDEIQRLGSVTASVMENLGPEGPGLLAVTGVPEASGLRRTLLPLARKLALLNNEDRKRLLKEHNLGSDVLLKNPNRNVSSSSMQLKYGILHDGPRLRLVQISDKCKVNKNEQAGLKQQGTEVSKGQSNDFGLWKLWHYDYGVFTVLTIPLFLLSSGQETLADVNNYSHVSSEHELPSPSGHTYLQIFDPLKNRVFMVKAPSESLIQVGEAADILSKGKLRATLHCVCRPPKVENFSRETFVVSKTLLSHNINIPPLVPLASSPPFPHIW